MLNVVQSTKYTLSKIPLKSHSQHTISTRTLKSGRRTNILTDYERLTTRLHLVAGIALTINSLSLLDRVLNLLCVKFKQYFMKFRDIGVPLETIH